MGMSLVACGDTTNNDNETSYVGKPVELTLWYCDTRLTTYLERVAQEYHESNSSITVHNVLVSREQYLQNIYNASVKEGKGPDLFISSSDDLEEICYMGLAWDNEDSVTYSVEKYGKAAIDAASYQKKMYGYPLAYETAVMVYNSDYAVPVVTLGDLEQFVKNYAPAEGEQGADFIAQWDVTDIFLNYPLIGNFLIIGGKDGDSQTVECSSEDFIRSIERFLSIKEELGIEKEYASYDKCLEQFVTSKLLYTIINTKDLKKLSEADVNYGVVPVPDYDRVYTSKPMSTTTLAIVSPYGNNKKQAINYAKAITHDYASEMVECGAGCPARNDIEISDNYKKAHEIYSNSIVKSQLIKTGDTYIKLEIMLNKVWNGTSISDAFNEFNQFMNIQWDVKK